MSSATEQSELAATLNLWSVTTLIGDALGAGRGLVNWRERFAASTAVDQHEVIGSMLHSGDREGAVAHIIGAGQRYARSAADRGTRFHAAAEAMALGASPLMDSEIEPYVRQWRRWLDRFQPEFVMVEAPVYNATEGYAGTTDGILKLEGRPFLFDYKTTEHPPTKESRPPYGEVALQLCAYAHATEVGVLSEQRYSGYRRYYLYDPTAKHEVLPEADTDWALAIIVSPYDCRAVPTRIDEPVWQAFLNVKEVARFQTELAAKRELFRPPFEAPPEEET